MRSEIKPAPKKVVGVAESFGDGQGRDTVFEFIVTMSLYIYKVSIVTYKLLQEVTKLSLL